MRQLRADKNISLSDLLPHKDLTSVEYFDATKTLNGLDIKLYDGTLTLIEDLPTKKKIKCTRSLVAMVRQATNVCFKNAEQAVNTRLKIKEWKRLTPETLALQKQAREEIDNQYRLNICRLETDVLNSILLCHKMGKMKRQKITLQAINDEITRRELLGDSSRDR